jgi:pimeloyl-ACP methyl ester carboxylesterase
VIPNGHPIPGWVADSLAHRPETVTIRTGPTTVTCSVWEPSGPPGDSGTVMLIHGNAANRAWWDCIAPLLARELRVVAVDLSGHGDSDRREEYTLEAWADEVLAVRQQLCAGAPTALVGHSMGGLVALKSAWLAPGVFSRVITLDTPLRRHSTEQLAKRGVIGSRQLPRYSLRETALATFKTVPAVRDALQPVIEHVANRSFRDEDGEWFLKFDPRIYRRITAVEDFLRPFPPNTVCVRAEHGLIDDEMASRIREHLGHDGRMLTIPAAGHHLLLEDPLATAWVIAAVM